MNDLANAEKSSALDAIRELLDTYFHEAEDSADEDGKFSLGFRATFNRSHSPTKLKVTCRVSKVTSDEPSGTNRSAAEMAEGKSPAGGCPEGDAGARRQIEVSVDDPAQPRLDGLE